jgi:ABC-2 type transport system permease protein
MKKIWTIMKHEFRMTAANKAFVIITIIGPFLIIAMGVLPGLLIGSGRPGSEPVTVGIVGGSPDIQDALKSAARERRITLERGNSLEAMKGRAGEDLEGILLVPEGYPETSEPFTYYSEGGTDIGISETLAGLLRSVVIEKRLIEAGIPPSEVKRLLDPPDLRIRRIADEGEIDFFSVIMTSIGFVMLIYMTVLLYGQMIGRAVIIEKSSKTVEIMLSSVRPRQLLFGKIFGRGLAGILQYVIWITVAVIIVRVLGPALGITPPDPLTLENLAFLFLFFILAFFLYSALYAALGAGAEDEQHLGQLSWPLIVFLVIPLTLISYFVMNPEAGIVVGLSFFPLTGPIVMLIRILVSEPAAWEILVCVAILGVSIFGAGILSARIFRVGILLTGKRRSLGEILRWIRWD